MSERQSNDEFLNEDEYDLLLEVEPDPRLCEDRFDKKTNITEIYHRLNTKLDDLLLRIRSRKKECEKNS